MKQSNSYKEGGHSSLSLFIKKNIFKLLVVIFSLSFMGTAGYSIYYLHQRKNAKDMQKELQSIKEKAEVPIQNEGNNGIKYDEYGFPVAGVAVIFSSFDKDDDFKEGSVSKPEILGKYQQLYNINPDMVGWLTIDGTIIDYPVMQTMENEDYYLNIDFYGKPNKNGCLMMDTDSEVGRGTAACEYADGCAPSTNLIIHGHTMKSGEMFGKLDLYADEAYGKEHSIIRFDSLYEEREYELIAVFYSRVFYEDENVFKYYKFFQADTQEQFDDWYNNIKKMSLYDTGVTAELGDEFITLSCCAYFVEDGRFVVVGKRKDNIEKTPEH